MPVKYQPDYIYLRHINTKRVHIFTIVQLICMIIMWIFKSIKAISICFPLMVSLIRKRGKSLMEHLLCITVTS